MVLGNGNTTNAELDELEALANAATDGPWSADARDQGGCIRSGVVPWFTTLDIGRHGWISGTKDGNAAFMAAAREAVPKLIARVRVLEDLLDQMEALLNEPPCDHCNNCDEGCWGPREESMQDRGSRALRGQIKIRDDE